MNDERDDLLREIGAALSVEPRPDFVARVRADAARQRVAWVSWRWVGAAAASAAVAIVALTIGLGPGGDSAARRAVNPSSDVRVSEDVALADVSPSPRTGSVSITGELTRSNGRSSAGRRYEVVVPDEQQVLFQRLMSDLRQGLTLVRASVDAVEMPTTDIDARSSVEIPSIQIEPTRFSEPSSGPLNDSAGG